ncbi:ATP-binding protein [Caproicibacter sp.]|uniref:ATP-binding protein n=1 Tax=Caproicibacter sp. TaxID=2814884 RepID=UPI0039892EAC
MSIVQISPEFFNNDAQANFDYSTHANPGFDILDIATSKTNILFEGIRGTGKTHILKAIREELLNKFDQKRILPIYISLSKVSEYEALSETMFRIHLYTDIVQVTVNFIKDNTRKLLVIEKINKNRFIKLLNEIFLFDQEVEDYAIEDILENVNILLDSLNRELLSGKLNIVSENSSEASAKLGNKEIGLAGKINEREQLEFTFEKLAHMNGSRYIVEFFRGLKNILNINYSLLLIDEISGVSNQAQIEVFRLLRLIRGATDSSEECNFIYFIGSVYPPQKTNYPSKAYGCEFDFIAGEDCSMEYLEMNVLNDDYEEFFRYITQKRLNKYHPESHGEYLWIFEDEKTFLLSAFAANGLPRRYFEILKNAYDIAGKKYATSTHTEKIDYNSVSSAIQNIVDSQILSESQLTDKDFEYLERIIIPKLSQRNSGAETRNVSRSANEKLPVHLFLSVTRTDRKKLSNLIYRGVIHNLSRTRKPRTIKSNEEEAKGLMLI